MNQGMIPGVKIPRILLPGKEIDLQKWAVIACDQFTSQPEYWKGVEEFIGPAPSTYHLILPEIYLGTHLETDRINHINQTMEAYVSHGFLEPHEGPVYVERTVNGRTRHGLMLCLDLEEYNYHKDSQTLIRSTEGTILERLPPRIRIRENAILEIPHIIALIDDPQKTVIEPLRAVREKLPLIYDFELMMGSGHLSGRSIANADLQQSMLNALKNLANPRSFQLKYRVGPEKQVLLVAIGDGNHSLATAKAIWEKIKPKVGFDHPARFALVEIENIHDDGLEFKPIHRLLFSLTRDPLQAFSSYYRGRISIKALKNYEDMIEIVNDVSGGKQKMGLVSPEGFRVIEISNPTSTLAVGTLQSFLDDFLNQGGAAKLDYVHGEEVILNLGKMSGNLGFYLPTIRKMDLFKTVVMDGVLPRKTFSMGEAREKRFYLECRNIA